MKTEEERIQVDCEQINKMHHALGISNAKKYHRHGKKYIKSYRNYYQTDNPDLKWEELIRFGLAGKISQGTKPIHYYVTNKGIAYMNEHLQAIIKETD